MQTYIGDTLVAVNPCRDLSIYTQEVRHRSSFIRSYKVRISLYSGATCLGNSRPQECWKNTMRVHLWTQIFANSQWHTCQLYNELWSLSWMKLKKKNSKFDWMDINVCLHEAQLSFLTHHRVPWSHSGNLQTLVWNKNTLTCFHLFSGVDFLVPDLCNSPFSPARGLTVKGCRTGWAEGRGGCPFWEILHASWQTFSKNSFASGRLHWQHVSDTLSCFCIVSLYNNPLLVPSTDLSPLLSSVYVCFGLVLFCF